MLIRFVCFSHLKFQSWPALKIELFTYQKKNKKQKNFALLKPVWLKNIKHLMCPGRSDTLASSTTPRTPQCCRSIWNHNGTADL
uniref:Uncharacterized protein n=1 Tax=Pyxicephalus adspersus TaxID=30357 RepID=A0AAV3AT81_PYXAD|nr:TPA: hypothetical protein GDO54_011464 [Pyxicephalus adspersus]